MATCVRSGGCEQGKLPAKKVRKLHKKIGRGKRKRLGQKG